MKGIKGVSTSYPLSFKTIGTLVRIISKKIITLLKKA